MAERKYPRQAWVLMPSFKPAEVTLKKPYGSFCGSEDWDLTEKGKPYHKDSLYLSKSAAIAAGREQVEQQRADIAKRQEKMNKRIAALDKAEKDAS
ncbi:hypothetical protein HH212_00155 [Massilia forsythiae]|uniref:Uncharacterized protein n=1 Tax=Massilia forsythiae TaxID=2728020 RepID=A0A7Z2VT79_9BURK|nr:hypothetical protein [Massilia forsythiae]QJD98649.1 hypothetical protein HH212_00155 [Massilia forsythiae]